MVLGEIDGENHVDVGGAGETVLEEEGEGGVAEGDEGFPSPFGLFFQSQHHLLQSQQGKVDIFGFIYRRFVGFEFVNAFGAGQIGEVHRVGEASRRVC